MEILLEAFRLIEGDHGLFPSEGSRPVSTAPSTHIPQPSAIERETCSSSDVDDVHSESTESSGRESPLSRLSDTEVAQVPVSTVKAKRHYDSAPSSPPGALPMVAPHPGLPHLPPGALTPHAALGSCLVLPSAPLVPCLPPRAGVIIHSQSS